MGALVTSESGPNMFGIWHQGDLQVILSVGREHVGAGFRDDVQVVVIRREYLLIKIGVGNGGGGCRKGGAKKRGRGYQKRWGKGVRGRSGGMGGGGKGQAGCAKCRVEGEHTRSPVDARVVTHQPRETKNEHLGARCQLVSRHVTSRVFS